MTVYVGYSGRVWSALFAGIVQYKKLLASAALPADTVAISEAMLASLFNGASAINANDMVVGWDIEQAALVKLTTMPLPLDAGSIAIIEARQTAYQNAYAALAALIPQAPYGAASSIVSGMPIIPDPGLLTFYQNFTFETPPSGLTGANFLANAAAVQGAFHAAQNAIIQFQGQNITSVYDTATREYNATGMISAMLGDMVSPVAAGIIYTNAWNQIVALPAMSTVGAQISAAPFTYAAQQSAVLRNLILNLAQQIAQYLLVLRQPQTAQINQTILRNGETLLDVAARTLNNFERWTEIATLNNLVPPYTAAKAYKPGIASWGQALLLPSPGTSLSAVGETPSYTANFLGTDIYFGPINGSMPIWTGDYQTITGYANLAWALGRRLQTTLGSLLYHGGYGSRIPPQVGAVATSQTAGLIAAYGKSAILSDPRVAKVPSAVASGSNNTIGFSATVQPAGNGAQSLQINQTISPLP